MLGDPRGIRDVRKKNSDGPLHGCAIIVLKSS